MSNSNIRLDYKINYTTFKVLTSLAVFVNFLIFMVYLIQLPRYVIILAVEVIGSIVIGLTMGYLRYVQINHRRPFNALKSTVTSVTALESIYIILFFFSWFFPSLQFQVAIEVISLILLTYATLTFLSLRSYKVKIISPNAESDYLVIETSYRNFGKIKSRFVWLPEENNHEILILKIQKRSYFGKFGIPSLLVQVDGLNAYSRYVCLAIDRNESNLDMVKLVGFEGLLQSDLLYYDIADQELNDYLIKINQFTKLKVIPTTS